MDIEQYGLTNQQKRFVEEYVVDLSAPKAAERAGYSKNMGTALLSRPQVQDAITDLSRELSDSKTVSAKETIEGLSSMARVSMADVYDMSDPKKPTMRPLSKEIMDAVQEVELADGSVKKMKLYNRMEAYDKLAKIHGLYVKRHEHSGINGKPIEVEHKYTDMEALVNKMDEMIEGNKKMKQAEVIEVDANVVDSAGEGSTDIM